MSAGNNATCVLLQEGDRDLRRVLTESLEQHGLQVSEATGEQHALAAMQQEPELAVLIVEFDLDGDSTERIIENFRAAADDGKVVVTTDDRLKDDWRRSVRPDAVIYKPFDTRYLIQSIDGLTQDPAEHQSTQR